jgi:hypothetical protein
MVAALMQFLRHERGNHVVSIRTGGAIAADALLATGAPFPGAALRGATGSRPGFLVTMGE